ncbi:MAG: hypothetical protein J2P22_04070 [Nocardioides sp.]|nr:hypothetical protein [Nocardioides sp.]
MTGREGAGSPRATRTFGTVTGRRDVVRLDGSVWLSQEAALIVAALVSRAISDGARYGANPTPRVAAVAESLAAAVRRADSDRWMTSSAAAALLGVSTRTVQRNSGALGGRRTPTGALAFDRRVLEEHLRRRQEEHGE